MLQRKSWSNRPGSSETRLRGRALRQARAELFKCNPLCVRCQKKGITRLATERDHVVPLFEGGTDDPSNTVGLCNPCHKEKTQQESNRARGITTKPRMRSGCDVNGFPSDPASLAKGLERLNAETAILCNRYSMRVLFQVSS
ncbi:HNH endonuclease signature motif containing protein [Nitrosospira sp. Nsp2]|uniref:HNH endonuclease n=1 Tax=Nitrosospira sp. Nsp2 TaxID=136548 RepID=UPI000D300208